MTAFAHLKSEAHPEKPIVDLQSARNAYAVAIGSPDCLPLTANTISVGIDSGIGACVLVREETADLITIGGKETLRFGMDGTSITCDMIATKISGCPEIPETPQKDQLCMVVLISPKTWVESLSVDAM